VILLSEKSEEKKDLVKVLSVTPLFPVGFSRAPIPPIAELHEQLSRPIIELKLENNENLRLMGIPYDIALEIWTLLKRKSGYRYRHDPRLSISQLFCEIARVEYIVITDILPDLGVYVADVYVKVKDSNDSEKVNKFKMIPSHAILLALLNNADIYVAKKLLRVEEGEEESEDVETKEFELEDITYW